MVRAQGTTAPTVCNGYAEFCDKPYSSITFVATHNSYANTSETTGIPQQLKAGVRAFLLDGHYNPNSKTAPIELCHTSCAILDAGKVSDTLKLFTTFLEQNPNEVITIFWENFDKIDPADYKTAYDTAGLTSYAYIPSSPTEWPTLSSLIQSNTRVINFIDTGANNATVPWLLSEYTYVFETPFENYDLNAWQCTVDRPKDRNPPPPMYLINHFLYQTLPFGNVTVEIPKTDTANVTNGLNLELHVQNCTKIFGKAPNFLAVDAYDQGSDGKNVFVIAAEMNNVTYVPPPSPKETKKSGSTVLSVNLGVNFLALIGVVTFTIFGL
ncbi:6448_t:CDS:2 [Acaulospora morrowiae]|uniref:6448_t:CDS:1 n=1 Tax=Acaulospora morrowiae TaxID=94023 RepID=A0A9N9DC77_9GLOM|nr:6448_t:CDS:2 [Acaulospora morrowiae]